VYVVYGSISYLGHVQVNNTYIMYWKRKMCLADKRIRWCK